MPHPGGIGGIFRGSNAETYVRGPDGSVISSEQAAGAGLQNQSAVAPAAVSNQTRTLQQVVVRTSSTDTVGPNTIETRVTGRVKRGQTRRKTSGTVEFTNQGLNLIPPIGQYSGSPLPLGHSTIIVETSKPLYEGN